MSSFKPAFGLRNRHLQTLFPTLFRSKTFNDFEIEAFYLEDRDFVDCYWVNKPSIKETDEQSPPIVIIFHGLTGSYRSSYIQGIMQHLSTSGYACVLMHFRGCSGRANNTARAYHSGDTEDAKSWISHVKQTFPNSNLFAIGFSLGANMLLKMLAEYAHQSPFTAAVAISAPMKLAVSATTLNRGFARIYQQYLLSALKKSLLLKYPHFDFPSLINLTLEKIKAIRTLEEFDELYTSKIHGFKSAQHYYQVASADQYLREIKTNTLIINAKDDPFMHQTILPERESLPKNITVEFTNNGGHLGFVSGSIFKPVYWLDNRITAFLNNKTG